MCVFLVRIIVLGSEDTPQTSGGGTLAAATHSMTSEAKRKTSRAESSTVPAGGRLSTDDPSWSSRGKSCIGFGDQQ